MSILSFLGGPFEKVANGVKSLIGAFVEDPGKRHELEVQIDTLLHDERMAIEATIVKELEAKERIFVAELQQSDNFTKRARPTVIYAGVIMAMFEAVMKALAYLSLFAPPEGFDGTIVPEWFYGAWAAYGSVYAIGRSMEKRARSNGSTPGRLVSMITGG
jgi:hypothetical protein